MANVNTELLLILGGVTVAVLLQAGVLLGIFLTVRKAVQQGREEANEFRDQLTPVLETAKQFMTAANGIIVAARKLIDAVDPKVQSAAAQLEQITHDLHDQTTRLNSTVDEIAGRVRRQADRVDGMTTSFLNGVDRVGSVVNEVINVPLRQINGLVAAAKAMVEALRAPVAPRPRRPAPTTTATGDRDLFV